MSPAGSSSRGKRVVKVETGADQRQAERNEPVWTPTEEARKKSVTFRWIAAALWALAIGVELFAIFWVLRQTPFTDTLLWLLIGLIVLTGVLSVVGSLLWKKANRLSPASKRDTVRFFVQNQLGAIIAVIAFLPLIVMIFLNKNMDGKQKGIAGGVAIVIAIAATLFGIDWNAPSQEQYAEEENIIVQLTGQNLVYWTKSGSVFHCAKRFRMSTCLLYTSPSPRDRG